jgi:hypothetical protein
MRNLHLSLILLLSLAAGLALRPAVLRAQAPSAPAQSQTPNPPPAQKKVWTNEDIDQLRDQGAGGISVMGPAAPPATPSAQQGNPAASGAPAKPAKAPALPKEKDPEWYRQQLAPLYAALDRINTQLAAAQAAVDGDSRGEGGVSMNTRAPQGTPQEQVATLQNEQAQVQARIDALLDMARHNDIEPGDLR